jgi:DNA-damage-inducible protein D
MPIDEDIISYLNNNGETDYKLSRFACYVIVMNSDPKKEQVARAQVYFAEQTRRFELMVQTSKDFERLKERNQFSHTKRNLDMVISEAGVIDYGNFYNAGYRGLYNMYNFELAKKRDLTTESLVDHMSDVEIAARSLQFALTGKKIKEEQITGQQKSADAHEAVGQDVRELIKRNVGVYPEELPVEKNIGEIKKDLKTVRKKMLKQDKKKKQLPPKRISN